MERTMRILAAVLLVPLMAVIIGTGREEVLGATKDNRFQHIDDYVQDQLDGSRIPGAAIAIVEDTEIVHSRGFGEDDGAAITARTPLPIGSLTKSFTALAVMQLVEAGRLELDAPIQQYIPWFEVATPDASSQITARHLMTQTSGFSRVNGLTPIIEKWDGSAEDYVRALRTVELNRPVGESYEYSNVNFGILGLLIEKLSGQSYGDYVRQHIFSPLGMAGSYTSHREGREHGMPALHRYLFGFPVEVETPHLPGQIAEGFLVSSAEDMARYLMLHLGNGSYEGERILSPEGIATLHQPVTEEFSRTLMSHEFTARYAMGWFAGRFGEQDAALWHLGDLPSFTAWMVLLPETNQGVIVLINASSQMEFAGATDVFSRIPIGITNLLTGHEAPQGIGLTRFYVIFNVTVLTIVALQLWALYRLLRRSLVVTFRPDTLSEAWRLTRTIGPLVWEVGLSLVILVSYPAMTGQGWRGGFWAIPDLTLVVLTVSGLWLLTGVVRTIRLIQSRIARRHASQALLSSPRQPKNAPAT